MKEEYLHYIFKTKQLGNAFETTNQQQVQILDFGIYNQNAGPDFLECKIRLDDKIWAGQIEFHVKSSDWLKHKHQFDSNYNNVILHVVYKHDLDIKSGEYTLPTIELQSKIDKNHFNKYHSYINSKNWVACQNELQRVDEFVVYQQKEKALLNRLQRKSKTVLDIVDQYKGDKLKTFYILLFKAFGTKVNQKAFETLGHKFDYKILAKLNYDLVKIQAYLFGLAGLLNDSNEDIYFNQLKREFEYQKKLFQLQSMTIQEWKFSTMRPSNLPTLRIAQLSHLLASNCQLNRDLSIDTLKQDLNINLDEYWTNHYMFNRRSKRKNNGLTGNFKNLLIINVYVPYFFTIGILEDDESLKQKMLDWLNGIKPETNSIINHWKKHLVSSKSAFDTQALIELKNEYCVKQQCLQCKIGQKLLSTS